MDTRKTLVKRMRGDGVKITAIAEALNISRQFMYRIIRGRTEREKQYHRHFTLGHKFQEDCPYCMEEKSVNP